MACCCNRSTVVVFTCPSAHCCNSCSFKLPSPSCQLEPVWPFGSERSLNDLNPQNCHQLHVFWTTMHGFLCKLQSLLRVKIPGDQQLLRYSNHPVWHQQSFHNSRSHFFPRSDVWFELQPCTFPPVRPPISALRSPALPALRLDLYILYKHGLYGVQRYCGACWVLSPGYLSWQHLSNQKHQWSHLSQMLWCLASDKLNPHRSRGNWPLFGLINS